MLSVAILPIERRFPLGRPGWAWHLLVLALVSVPMAYAAWLMTAALGALVEAATGRASHPMTLGWLMPARDLLGHELLYWTAVAGSTALRTLVDARENERRAARLMLEKAQLATSLRQAELDALRMRLQPHFLFNSLQNISVLTQHDPVTAGRMLTRLGDLLRASLARDREAETTLDTEIALTSAYLAVEGMRFGDRLASTVDVAPGTEQALVPTFLLQPLVENALRHGLHSARRLPSSAACWRSGARATATGWCSSSATTGSASPAAFGARAFGIGLGATCERLARLYRERTRSRCARCRKAAPRSASRCPSAPARRRSPSMRTLRVLIADDEPLIRLGIRRALEAMPDVTVAGECGAVADAVALDRAGSRPISSSSTCRCRAARASTSCARSARRACRR